MFLLLLSGKVLSTDQSLLERGDMSPHSRADEENEAQIKGRICQGP